MSFRIVTGVWIIASASMTVACGGGKTTPNDEENSPTTSDESQELGELRLSAGLTPALPDSMYAIQEAYALTLHEGPDFPFDSCKMHNSMARTFRALRTAAQALCHFETGSSDASAGDTLSFTKEDESLWSAKIDDDGSIHLCKAGVPAFSVESAGDTAWRLQGQTDLEGGVQIGVQAVFTPRQSGKRQLFSSKTRTVDGSDQWLDRTVFSVLSTSTSLIGTSFNQEVGGKSFEGMGSYRVGGDYGMLFYHVGEEQLNATATLPPMTYRYNFGANGQMSDEGLITDETLEENGPLYVTETDVPTILADGFDAGSPTTWDCEGATALAYEDDPESHAACDRLAASWTVVSCEGPDWVTGTKVEDFDTTKQSDEFDDLEFPDLD